MKYKPASDSISLILTPCLAHSQTLFFVTSPFLCSVQQSSDSTIKSLRHSRELCACLQLLCCLCYVCVCMFVVACKDLIVMMSVILQGDRGRGGWGDNRVGWGRWNTRKVSQQVNLQKMPTRVEWEEVFLAIRKEKGGKRKTKCTRERDNDWCVEEKRNRGPR